MKNRLLEKEFKLPTWLLSSGDLEKDCEDSIKSIQQLLSSFGEKTKVNFTAFGEKPIIQNPALQDDTWVRLKSFSKKEVWCLRYAILKNKIAHRKEGKSVFVQYGVAKIYLLKSG
jgi:hypothetical protein